MFTAQTDIMQFPYRLRNYEFAHSSHEKALPLIKEFPLFIVDVKILFHFASLKDSTLQL